MNAKVLTDLADQLYDLSEYAVGGEHNLKAAAVTGSFDVVAFLEAIVAAAPEILALVKILLGKSVGTP